MPVEGLTGKFEGRKIAARYTTRVDNLCSLCFLLFKIKGVEQEETEGTEF